MVLAGGVFLALHFKLTHYLMPNAVSINPVSLPKHGYPITLFGGTRL
jgi:hypothetical protein